MVANIVIRFRISKFGWEGIRGVGLIRVIKGFSLCGGEDGVGAVWEVRGGWGAG